jgi:hypothetical protein
VNLDLLSPAEQRELIAILEEQAFRRSRRKLFTYYPDTGPLRRELYPKHLAFFRAGAEHRERLMLAANRVGKTEGVGGYETALHLTGRYPAWWDRPALRQPGRGGRPARRNETTRDIIQGKLFGRSTGAGRARGERHRTHPGRGHR